MTYFEWLVFKIRDSADIITIFAWGTLFNHLMSPFVTILSTMCCFNIILIDICQTFSTTHSIQLLFLHIYLISTMEFILLWKLFSLKIGLFTSRRKGNFFGIIKSKIGSCAKV